MSSNVTSSRSWSVLFVVAGFLGHACGGQANGDTAGSGTSSFAGHAAADEDTPAAQEEPDYSASGGAPSDRRSLGTGNIGGMQFRVATRCDGCSWQRTDDRCLDLVSAMPYIDEKAYYPCGRVSSDFAACIADAPDLCDDPAPPACADELAAVESCVAAPPERY